VGALAYAGPAARAAGGIPVIHTEHGKHYAARWRTRMLGRLAGRFADRFLCVSGDIAAEVERHGIVPKRKLGVVPNGIDSGRFATRCDRDAARAELGIPARAPLVGTVGRLNEVKRQDRLIRGFAEVVKLVPEAHLLLVGDGPLLGELRDLAGRLNVAKQVHFAGYQSHPERYLATIDIFALTSRSEGMPLAVLEAWAAGVPVIASNVGGLREMIDHGRTGLLFDAEDERALATILSDLIADDGRARALADAGRREVEAKYSLRGMSEAYQRHYLDVITARGLGVSRGSSQSGWSANGSS
jgi:glycosyltransferase involved in cell wall biosynthesis